MKKLAKELVAGDRIILEDGEVVKVKSVGRGFVRFLEDTSVMIDHGKGWSQVPSRMEVTLAEAS